MLKLFGLFVLLLGVATDATSADWDQLDASSISVAGKQVRVYIENESIVKSGNTVTLWEKIWIDANGYFIVSNSSYDCKMKTSKDNEAFALERDGSRSKYSLNYPHSDYEYSPVPPDTADEIVFSRLCSSKWYEFWK